jgi:hypothetical protein
MALEDREEIVATIQETYILMGRAIQADAPDSIRERALRRDVVESLLETPIEYVTDQELLGLFQETYFGLVDNVIQIQDELLADHGPEFDRDLERVGLTSAGRALKVRMFRRAVDRVRQLAPGRWLRKAFKCGNIILGSLGPVPIVGIAAEPIQELKEAIETQGEEDQESR